MFWQTDEHDQPAIITEPYEKAFTAANLKKELEFYASDLTFCARLKVGKTAKIETPPYRQSESRNRLRRTSRIK